MIYNSGGYETVETIRSLNGLINIYLPDLKYISPDLSERYSGARDYFEKASRAILEMCRQTGAPAYDETGRMLSGTIVRHLILPSHMEESKAILRWCKEHLPQGTPVSVMAQYLPLAEQMIFRRLIGGFPKVNIILCWTSCLHLTWTAMCKNVPLQKGIHSAV